MPVIRLFTIAVLVLLATCTMGQPSYMDYHQRVIRCEQHIVAGNFDAAITSYDSLFWQYDERSAFLRDFKVAAQLCLLQGDTHKCFSYIHQGIQAGWSWKELESSTFFDPIKNHKDWAELEKSYAFLHEVYTLGLDIELADEVQPLYKKDQRKALAAWLRFGDKAQTRYNEKRFAPHSEQQLARLRQLIKNHGFPGERLVGNNYWGSTILCHHNSISQAYVLADTLYPAMRPMLHEAMQAGELSPFEYALMEDWRTAVSTNHAQTSYGFIGPISNREALAKVNANRANIGMRSIELRNALFRIQLETGLIMYLPGMPWQDGEIAVGSQ